MAEVVRIVTRTQRQEAPLSKEFTFVDGPRLTGYAEIDAYRKGAWANFESLGLPSVTEEAWRRTDLKGFEPGGLRLAGGDSGNERAAVVAAPGKKHPARNDVEVARNDLEKMGVIFTDLLTAEREHPEVVAKLIGKLVNSNESKFAALAGACANTGILLYVPAGVRVDAPLYSLLQGGRANTAQLSHVLVWLDEGASATLVYEMASPTDSAGQALHAGNVEILVGRGASLKLAELQALGEHTWNFTHERARVEGDAKLEWVIGAVGSRLTKNFSNVDLTGAGAEARVSGFYFTHGQQHLDYDTEQNHFAPHTTSDLLFKGALKGKSRTVWQGMIYVAPGADKTDGYQANRNIILEQGARADSIPGLEILADDVRCTHGATVGKIDAEQMYYLETRGIPRNEAERLIVEGFFEPVMERIPFEDVKDRLEEEIRERLKG